MNVCSGTDSFLFYTASLAYWLRRLPRERNIPDSNPRIPLALGFFQGRVIPVTSKLALQWLTCQAPGVIGLVPGLVGPVSIYCDLVRWKVRSATSISVWQHVTLSEQICPCDTLVFCWDVKQPITKPNIPLSFTEENRTPEGVSIAENANEKGLRSHGMSPIGRHCGEAVHLSCQAALSRVVFLPLGYK